MDGRIVSAIQSRRLIRLVYDGYHRTVEPHSYGQTAEGNDLVSVWQVDGGSKKGERRGWKNFRLDETRAVEVLNETFQGPRTGYKRGNIALHKIYAQL